MLLHLLPNIRHGTERYPEKVARRLRTLNIATWIAAAVPAIFAVLRFLDPVPGRWKIGIINALAALAFASIPLLHRFGPQAATLGFVVIAYPFVFWVSSVLGTDGGTYLYYFTAMVLGMLFLGTERILFTVTLAVVGVGFIIALHMLVPHDTGFVPPAMLLFGNFVTNVVATSAILFAIVFYALREAARAEATAQREYERSETLLANILPATIAARLKSQTNAVIADKYGAASILFADMAGFTERASAMAPDDLVQFLNRVFTDFDRLVESRGLEKIKTTGDSYMVVSGVPAPRPDHAQALAQLALDMRDAAMELYDSHGRSVPIRIGIGSGPVVAGVVGTRKFFYDVWGDAVNLASRMESTGIAGKIQVSQEVYECLKNEFVLEDRGVIDVKGKGAVRTWFLIGRRTPSAPQRRFA